MKSFAWPDSDLEFSSTDPNADIHSPTFCCLDWMKHHVSDIVLARYYAEAADTIVERRLTLPQSNSIDGLFMPVAYLYRHSIELHLKELLRFFVRVGEVPESKELERILQRHGLRRLWLRVEQPVRKLGNSPTDPVADNVASFLRKLDACDPGGTSMRYARSTDGSKASSDLFPARVDLLKLRHSVKAVNNFLSGSLDYASALYGNLPDY